MNTIVMLTIDILSATALSLIGAVVFHEVGHLIGGKIYGYRFSSLSLFWMTVYKRNGKYRITEDCNRTIGRCLMYTKDEERNGFGLIMGGCLLNLLIGIVCILVACNLNLKGFIYLFTLGLGNLLSGVHNVISSSPFSDGKTYGDIRKYGYVSYNRIMCIMHYLTEGISYKNMPEILFEDVKEEKSLLGAELCVYAYYRECEITGMTGKNAAYLKECKQKMARFNTGKGIDEAVAIEAMLYSLVYEGNVHISDACVVIDDCNLQAAGGRNRQNVIEKLIKYCEQNADKDPRIAMLNWKLRMNETPAVYRLYISKGENYLLKKVGSEAFAGEWCSALRTFINMENHSGRDYESV